MSEQQKHVFIVAKYTFEKKAISICKGCKLYRNGCELKGRHVDAVVECFMFGMDEKKGGKG